MSAVSLNQKWFGGFSLPGRTLGLTFICLALFAIGQNATDLFVYDRYAIEMGEWWRLLTGQFVHIGLDHVFWDVSAFLMLAALIEKKGARYYWCLMMVCFLPIGLYVHCLLPHLTYYSGLSGGLNTLFFVTTWHIWKRDGGWLAPALLIGNTAKILYEIYIGDALFTETAWPPLPEVHAIGFICGMFWIAAEERFKK